VFAEEYAIVALQDRPGSLPGGPVMAWLGLWTFAPALAGLIAGLPLLFPTGRPLSRRWWPVGWTAVAATFVATVPMAVVSWWYRGPRLLDTAEPPAAADVSIAVMISLIGQALLLICALAAIASLVLRLRRARGVERQQVKWLAYAIAVAVAVNAASDAVPPLGWLEPLTVLGLIAGIGIAMLRHRLYDIDLIINRTLVYGLLSAALGGAYAGLVLALGPVFGRSSSLAVAVSTLAVAALFQPLRRRIQNAVDHRFNRRRYDSAKTIAAFSARLREQVELDTLSAELLAVVDQTMQPTRASLWLRPPGETR
jgi:hypothetical protein